MSLKVARFQIVKGVNYNWVSNMLFKFTIFYFFLLDYLHHYKEAGGVDSHQPRLNVMMNAAFTRLFFLFVFSFRRSPPVKKYAFASNRTVLTT